MAVQQKRSSSATASDGRPLSAAPESSLQLLRRAQSGDPVALDVLYQRYLGPLQRWARGRLPRWARDAADTDDLVQDTLLQSLRGVRGFDPRHSGAFQAYLRQALLNRMRDELRRAKRQPAADGTASQVVDPAPLPVDEVIGRERLGRYESALQRLRAEDRELIFARVELGFSYQQIAKALGKPTPDAARVAAGRAILRLAREMADEQR